jgi:hypothetical protein
MSSTTSLTFQASTSALYANLLGSPAVSGRPAALRTGLATGVPFQKVVNVRPRGVEKNYVTNLNLEPLYYR